MKIIDNIQIKKPIKGKNLPAKLKTNMVLVDDDFPLNISPKLSFIRWFVLFPFFGKFCLAERNQEFLIVDYLIFGDNPILNIILLKKILNKAIASNQKLTVGIVQQKNFDYWGYHYYSKNILDFQNLLNELQHLEHPLLEIIHIRDNFEVSHFRQQDLGFGIYHFFLKEKDPRSHFIEESMPHLAEAQKRLKQSFLWEFNSKFKHLSNVHQLFFSLPSPGQFNHLFCKNAFYTNYQHWLSYQKEIKSYPLKHSDNQEINCSTTIFHHDVFEEQLFGSAHHLPDSFEFLEDFVAIDIERIQNIVL